MQLGVTGFNSTITQGFKDEYEIVRIEENHIPYDIDYFLLCAGVIHNKRIEEQTRLQRELSAEVNLIIPIVICEKILSTNPDACICIMGSESGFKGSYDMGYAAFKSAIHWYVETKEILFSQQLFAVAPHIIRDSNMAKRRHDYEKVKNNKDFITTEEVVDLIKHHFDKGTCNEVVRPNRA